MRLAVCSLRSNRRARPLTEFIPAPQAITLAMFSDASIINMSFVFRVPATLSWSLVPFNLATLRANGAGKLLYASAGNDAEDINDEDCFIVCWEAAWIAPCENGGVICVGAMDANAPLRRTSSNYGGDELDIWGAGSVWVALRQLKRAEVVAG